MLHERPHDRVESELVDEDFKEVGRDIQAHVIAIWVLFLFSLTLSDEVEESEIRCRVDHNRQSFPLVAPD